MVTDRGGAAIVESLGKAGLLGEFAESTGDRTPRKTGNAMAIGVPAERVSARATGG
jgi:hypothetical protein